MHKLEDLIEMYITLFVRQLEGIIGSLDNVKIKMAEEYSPFSENHYLYAFLDDFRNLCCSRLHILLEELESLSIPKKPYESAALKEFNLKGTIVRQLESIMRLLDLWYVYMDDYITYGLRSEMLHLSYNYFRNIYNLCSGTIYKLVQDLNAMKPPEKLLELAALEAAKRKEGEANE